MIDNYDSFTFNLVQELLRAGAEVEVVRNDAATVDDLLAMEPRGIVISPGPGRPEEAGICPRLVARRPRLPILGVCLGHQVLGHVFGARVERAPELVHGKTSAIVHEGAELFAGLPSPFDATRYHSLTIVPETLPPELEPLAWTRDGVLMGMRHRELPYWGVQFHPESVLTVHGPRILTNFLDRCAAPAGGGGEPTA
ncbi:MAG: aminodeoxychorismate/anthranilate synthase component II [Acidobacteriota bacterium]|nr:aminodeoxychorismate/anthranilate synthase component II [Acidobacteriota bacterium]MDH3522384.1 aminodeoxychorismate/anthranilate synthase component II [Acidobacteriota bacterium]